MVICMIKNISSLKERYVGKKFKNLEIDEKFTVIGVNKAGLALLQYEDGTAYDEIILPDIINSQQAQQLNVSEYGLDDGKYYPLDENGPTIKDSCDKHHDWSIYPSEYLEDKDKKNWVSIAGEYLKVVKCEECGLSGDSICTFLGEETPAICYECNSDMIPGEDKIYWDEVFLCENCY